jgi:TRAP-type C4-dicarboxylate transport system substrate-binding protein
MSKPIQIRMGGYGPATTGFSKALKFIGDRLIAEFGDAVDIKYVWNIMDFGYRSEDILWLVESGVLSLGYQSSSYLTDRVPELGFVDLPFLFADRDQARGAMDGALGATLTKAIEDKVDYRIVGWFENGFRHISNHLRPVRSPADLAGMTIRVLPSEIQKRTFALLGAVPQRLDLTEALEMIVAGTIDAQENPLANTVTYGAHKYHPFHTLTGHFYISRPIFNCRAQFDAWPKPLQEAMRRAAQDAVGFQRGLAIEEERDARRAIEAQGCRIEELTPAEHALFADAVAPMMAEAEAVYGAEMLRQVGR